MNDTTGEQAAGEVWEERYREGRTGWQRPGTNPVFDAWLAEGFFSASPARRIRVLIPGCGRSHELLALARRGIEVTGVDVAPTAVKDAQAALVAEGLAGEVLEADFFQWEPEQPFDVVYEQTSLCAIDPAERDAYAERLHGWLRPGGLLLALFMQRTTEKEGSASDPLSGPPFHCDLADMRSLFGAAKWEWPQEPPRRGDAPMGEELHELGVVLRRR